MLYLVNNDNGTEGLIRLVSDSLRDLYAPLGTVAVTHAEIALKDIRWSTRVLSSARLNFSQKLAMRLINSRVGLFPFYFYVNPEGACEVITPPIVEAYCTDHGGRRYLLLDGSHRCYAAMAVVSNVSVLAVSFVSAPRPLPCKPLLPSAVRVLESQPRLKELFVNMSESDFRPVRQLAHKNLRFPSLKDALLAMKISESSLSLLEDANP